ncbi:glycosyl hydrolase 115 family protein [Flavivirga eckloniae]|uniref:Alpha glucuronidase N-terminal domain-containing protein n=1 Tax=Flavivirga eckloniae TaxID=1803846 RepID=A0A2K9PP24_9FLAO|nr:glycosyl hydrolase 115 family protein [Flavivirga eckloniae]AUP78823.1 hypothetical protein C1H87_08965 [Flavivirga eckloniae]
MKAKYYLLCIALLFIQSTLLAQHWQEPVRGAWLHDSGIENEGVVLVEDNRVVDIVVSSNTNSAVKQAALFLASDIEKITGKKPEIVSKSNTENPAIHLVTLGEGVIPKEIDTQKLNGKWEAHHIKTIEKDIWLVGSNFRGTAFAAYTLSERIGIDPLYHWTGYEPDKKKVLKVKSIDHIVDEPTFKYRGFFHDDEDTLPTPLDKNGYPQYAGGKVDAVWYERYFETALRLRMNQVAPFVRVLRPYEVQKKASDWGLFYTSHHYDILLSNPLGFHRFGLAKERGIDGDYSWFNNNEGILKYWRGGVEENKDINCIWPVGLRGTADTSYKFPEGTTQEDKNKVFTDAIKDQVKMTKSVLGKGEKPVFHFTLYGEMLTNYQKGNFDFPEDVILVWNDDGDAKMRALPETLGKWKHGIYYHLAYYGHTTKQTHHTVKPHRIEQEFRKVLDAGATEYMLVNVSEMREFVMNARFLAEICWDAKTAFFEPNAADRYVEWWSREYFGDMAANDVVQSYNHYFDILHSHNQIWEGSKNFDKALDRLRFRLKGDHHIRYNDDDKNHLEYLNNRLAKYDDAFLPCKRAVRKMNSQQARFFFENVELGLLFDYHTTKAAGLINEALSKYPDKEALNYANKAMKTLEILEQEILKAERPPFENWYRDTWIRRKDSWTSVHYAYHKLKDYLSTYESRYK